MKERKRLPLFCFIIESKKGGRSMVGKFDFLKIALAQPGRLSEDEEMNLLQKYHNGEPQAYSKLRLSLRPLVERQSTMLYQAVTRYRLPIYECGQILSFLKSFKTMILIEMLN
jgi:hypothetical protein